MRRAGPLLTILTAAALAGCGAAQGGDSTPTVTPASAGTCADVVREGSTVTDALIDHGCTDGNGTKRVGKVTRCENGQRLWEMDGLIGLSGKPMLAENAKSGDGLTARVLNETACRL